MLQLTTDLPASELALNAASSSFFNIHSWRTLIKKVNNRNNCTMDVGL